jgi:histone chaperone ASF1
VILITCSYQDREFVRIGYYVNNDYLDEELRENPPESIAYDKLYRSILAEKPRVTRFPINWYACNLEPAFEFFCSGCATVVHLSSGKY